MAIRAPHGVSAAGITKSGNSQTGKAGSGPGQMTAPVAVQDYPFTDWWFGMFHAQQFLQAPTTQQPTTDT